MATIEVTLKHGLLIGDDVLREVVLREATAGDILDAQEESEKLLLVPGKDGPSPQLVASPALIGIHGLRRQVARIGNMEGPLPMAMIRKLHPDDLNLLLQKAEELEIAAGNELSKSAAASKNESRGRDDRVGGAS